MTIHAKLKLRDTRAQKKLEAALQAEHVAMRIRCVAWEKVTQAREELRAYEIKHNLKESRP